MLKIRLSRTGKKSQPSFRIVVQEHSSAVKGKFIEELGFYRPADNPKVFKVDLERVKYWISVGAQPSDSLASLLKRHEDMEGMDRYIGPRDKKAKKKKEPEEPKKEPEEPKEEAPAAEEKPAADSGEAKAETPKPEAAGKPAEPESSEAAPAAPKPE